MFSQWSKDYPNLAAKHSIGKSVQGRELLEIAIGVLMICYVTNSVHKYFKKKRRNLRLSSPKR